MRMESVPSLKVHLLTVVCNMTVPQTSFLQCGPVKDNLANLAMSNGVLMLYYASYSLDTFKHVVYVGVSLYLSLSI